MISSGVTDDPTCDLVSRPRPSLAREFLHLWLLARSRLSRGARPWLGVATALGTVLVAVFLHSHILRPEFWKFGDVYAALPLMSELARLPMSLFFPTSFLPLWAASAQLLVVIGLGELLLGRWLTIVVAMVGHIGSTLIARVLLESVHGYVLGLTPALARALDTGPSAATVAVGACLLVTAKMNRCALLLGVGLFAAALIAPGVDGVEHATALVWGLTAGVINYLVISRFSETRDTPSSGPWNVQPTSLLRFYTASLRLVERARVELTSRNTQCGRWRWGDRVSPKVPKEGRLRRRLIHSVVTSRTAKAARFFSSR